MRLSWPIARVQFPAGAYATVNEPEDVSTQQQSFSRRVNPGALFRASNNVGNVLLACLLLEEFSLICRSIIIQRYVVFAGDHHIH
jgi:hypothetical protein